MEQGGRGLYLFGVSFLLDLMAMKPYQSLIFVDTLHDCNSLIQAFPLVAVFPPWTFLIVRSVSPAEINTPIIYNYNATVQYVLAHVGGKRISHF